MSEDGELWCFFRSLISQGTYIQMDYAAGKYKCYEEFSARLDEAARERVDHFKANRALQRQSSQETPPARMRELNAKFAGRERGDDYGELTPRLDEETKTCHCASMTINTPMGIPCPDCGRQL